MGESVSAPNVSANYKDFFNPSFAGQFVEINYIDTQLIWDTMLTTGVSTDADSIKKYLIMVNSSGSRVTPATSSQKRSPALHVPGSFIPKIKQDDYTIRYTGLEDYAIGFDLDEDILARDTPINRMNITGMFDKIGRGFLEHMNGEILSSVYGNFSYTSGGTLSGYLDNEDATAMGYDSSRGYLCGKLDSGSYWSGDNADYLTDLTNIKTLGQKQTGYQAMFSRGAADITLLEDMSLWGQTNGYSWELSALDNGRQLGTGFAGWTIVGLNNTDGMSGHEDKFLFFNPAYKPGLTHFSSKNWPNYSRWNAEAKISAATQDYGPDEGNRKAMLFRYGIKTIIQPYHEYHYGLLETY